MSIRPGEPSDIEAIRRIAAGSWHAAYDHLVGADAVEDQLEEWYAPATIRDRLDDDSHLLVAEREGTVDGFGQAGVSSSDRADAVIAALYVDPAHWGEGLGTALLAALTARLHDGEHDDVWLEVLADNDVGRDFYASHGFEVLDTDEASIADVEAAVLIMGRTLPRGGLT